MKVIVPIAAVAVLGLGGVMYFAVGRDFYPLIDGGQIQLHVRAPAGTRIETTESCSRLSKTRFGSDPRSGSPADCRQYRPAGPRL